MHDERLRGRGRACTQASDAQSCAASCKVLRTSNNRSRKYGDVFFAGPASGFSAAAASSTARPRRALRTSVGSRPAARPDGKESVRVAIVVRRLYTQKTQK